MANDRKFASGFYYNEPHVNAPTWVIGKMSVKVDQAIPFLQENVNEKGYVNLDICKNKAGDKMLVFLNEYKKAQPTQAQPEEEIYIPGEESF